MTPWAVINPARLAGSGLLRTQSDARLVDLVRAGNDRAFEAIVLRYHRPLLRHCRRLLPSGRAEDAVQQSLLRALEAMRADDRDLQLGPWLHRIAHNTAIDSLRRLDSHWEELDERMDGVEPTHAAVERRARFNSVVSSMGSLPERQRRALVLRELEGRSYEEIAVALGVSGAGVRQLLNRARNSMRAAASALVPPSLVARIAGSPTGMRVAELVDPPGTGALMAKATAAVAAGAVALLAVSGPPSGDGGSVPRAEAGTRPPAVQDGRDAGGGSTPGSTPAGAVAGARASRAKGPGRDGRGDGQVRGQRGTGRGAAGPGAVEGGEAGDRDGSAPGGRPAPGGRSAPGGRMVAGNDGDRDDDASAPGTRGGSSDDDDDAPTPGAPAASDDGDDDGATDDGAGTAVTPPPAGGGGDDEADDGAPATSGASVPAAPAATPDEDAEEADD
jgi:RNA polymerase sigma factor (sigma-70 family)